MPIKSSPSEQFCRVVTSRSDMGNATCRVGVWLIGAAERLGGFPIELAYRNITDGFVAPDGTVIEGTKCHSTTINAAMDWLVREGLVKLSKGRKSIADKSLTIIDWA